MNEDQGPGPITAMVFVLEKDRREREAMRETIAETGSLAIALESADAAISLLQNQAACDLIILSTDAMDDDPARFDRLVASRNPPPNIIVYGVDPAAKLVLHCLNKGATDFLAKPFSRDELVRAVEHALSKDGPPASSEDSEAIVGSSPITGWIELTASSQLEQFRRLQRFSDALFASRLPQQICEDLKMAVEEVGRNAVEWGNHFDPDKQVHISYCMFDDRVVIKVEDEGEGFKPTTVPDPTADPVKTMQDRMDAGKRPGGYGVYLIQRLVDDIVYNEKGNTVLLIKYLPQEDDLAPAGKD
jgi:serine/threonine-protein kinase RsbW